MNILDYSEVKKDFNERIFKNFKLKLLESLSKNPERFIGLFRPTKPYTKLIQNITQSHEIKFGDGFEVLIRKIFEKLEYKSLKRSRDLGEDGTISFDQLFKKEGDIIMIEQKIRDDHDSTKKEGQMNNFKKKLEYLVKNEEGYDNLRSYFYFIDESFKKNKKYYSKEICQLNDKYNKVEVSLVYGEELFNKEKNKSVWKEEVICFLKKWREELPKTPELNFDKTARTTFDEIKDLSPGILKKLFGNTAVIDEIFPIIFPENKTLDLLSKHYLKKSRVYEELYKELHKIIERKK